MRALALVALTGCTQLFGLSDPGRRDAAASDASDGATLDMAQDATGDAPGPQACGNTDPALIGCFDFEDSVENVSPYILSVVASNYTFGTGRLGKAVHMDATTSFVIADNASLDQASVTVEMWIYVEALPATGARMGLWDTDGQYGVFLRDTGAFYCSNLAGVASADGVITINTWLHVGCTSDTTAVTQYANGIVTGTGAGGVLATAPATGSAIGGNAPSGDRFVGYIDSLRVYNYARSAAQICASAGC